MILFMIPIGQYHNFYSKMRLSLVFVHLQFSIVGAYHDKIDDGGLVLADHQLFGSVVATILVVVVTAQVDKLEGF